MNRGCRAEPGITDLVAGQSLALRAWLPGRARHYGSGHQPVATGRVGSLTHPLHESA